MAPRGKGVATILVIGTANPPNVFLQADYPDFYFKDVNIDSDDEHLQRLKLKFKRICMFIFLFSPKKMYSPVTMINHWFV